MAVNIQAAVFTPGEISTDIYIVAPDETNIDIFTSLVIDVSCAKIEKIT